MTRHDMQLWSFANKELELGEHRFIEAHLEVCPECSEQLAAIQVA
jgi:anti-sigma factor ChrR (cupin superfamily)